MIIYLFIATQQMSTSASQSIRVLTTVLTSQSATNASASLASSSILKINIYVPTLTNVRYTLDLVHKYVATHSDPTAALVLTDMLPFTMGTAVKPIQVS